MRDVFQANFGGRLKAAREAKNLASADVAAKLKLTARQVEALEQEDFGHLPSEVFVRGFVRNYARLVGIEPESLIAPVDAQAEVSETITAPNAGLNVDSNGIRLWLVYPIIGLVSFLLLVAALYYWLRQGEDVLIESPPEAVSQVDSNTAENVLSAPVVAPQTDVAALAADQVAPPALIDGAGDSGSSATTNTASNVGTEAASSARSAQPAPTALSPTPEVALPAPASDVNAGARNMRFEPATDAWIQVVDGKGARFSKLVRAGSAESFAGVPPFRLVVGEAALVKLTYNGHSIDLTPFIGQKVARLTLE